MEYPRRIPIDGLGVAVLGDPDEKLTPPRYSNLTLEGPDGEPVWWATIPTSAGHDWFVSVELDQGVIRAASWSGYIAWIEPATGKTIRTVFTK